MREWFFNVVAWIIAILIIGGLISGGYKFIKFIERKNNEQQVERQKAGLVDAPARNYAYTMQVDGDPVWCVYAENYNGGGVTCNWDAYNEQRRNR